MTNIILIGLLAGLIINIFDVSVTVLTVAKKWNEVLKKQGIDFTPFTPAYYVTASFVAGILLVWFSKILFMVYGMNRGVMLFAAISIWFITRLYGAGHVVMKQMPFKIFAVMSLGLLLGFVIAGQLVFSLIK